MAFSFGISPQPGTKLRHVFDPNVLVIFGPGSGNAVLGALLSHMRVVAVC